MNSFCMTNEASIIIISVAIKSSYTVAVLSISNSKMDDAHTIALAPLFLPEHTILHMDIGSRIIGRHPFKQTTITEEKGVIHQILKKDMME